MAQLTYRQMWAQVHDLYGKVHMLGSCEPMEVVSLWKRLLDPLDAAGMPFPNTLLSEDQIRVGLNNDEFTALYRWFHRHPQSPLFDYKAAADFVEEHFERAHFS